MSESQEVTASGAVTGRVWDPADFRAGIEATLQDFVDQQSAWLADLGEDASRLVEHARVSVSGGKRFRAAFCWWGHLAVAEPEDRHALLRACASLELLHASALVHDDVMDASDVRRGRPATHRAFEALHQERGWSASAEQYGAAAAATCCSPGPTSCCAPVACPHHGCSTRSATST